ncbi:unnamed protein product [Rotaria sordida]|uniref:Uncharacterized protein n=1 Tax=Rotaria sordida TaxID=392033 RepID=A0A813R9Z3_9BILA|nr:unnamed protein product [Rotaria sordida]CAF3603637.1 unnamed protein product [Rotaria sordida]
MSLKSFIYNDCCLLINIDLNSQRIRQLLERRFKSNSNRTSFDFKLFPPEQPSNNAKVSRSFLRYQPKIISTNDYEENLSTDSSSSEEEDNDDVFSTNDDDYLNKLAEWEPENFRPTIDEDDDDNDEDENANIIQSTSEENNNEDNETNQMDYSIVENAPTTHTEDLLVTFIHRPLKTEPISYDNNIFQYPPQLDGQIDFSSTKSSTGSNRTINNKNLDDIIAKVKAKTSQPSRAIEIHRVPLSTNKCRSHDDIKNKFLNQTIKTKSLPIPPKTNRIKEQTKKIKPRLLSTVLKNNEDAIRPLETRIPSIQTNNQKSSRTSSTSNLQSPISKQQDQKQNLLNRQRIPSQQQIKSSSNNKQKYNLQPKQSKEKSASVHMTLAEQKLNHYQQLTSSISKTSNSNTISSTIKSKSKEFIKNQPKLSKSTNDLSVQNSESTTPILNDHNQHIKKKPQKIKRLNKKQTNLLLNNQSHIHITKQKPKEHNIIQKPKLVSHQSEPLIHTTTSNDNINKRPENFFNDCIIIDDDEQEEYNNENNNNNIKDDEIQEIEQKHYSISYDIRTREKLLDHAVHSSLMHIKWLFNLEYLLLEHILICHEKHIHPLNKIYENSSIIKYEHPINLSYYNIDPSFISIIIINFIKMFILRNSFNDQQEYSFIQCGITSHIRYLLIELPTYNHNEEKDINDNCFKCHQYSLIINILFDLLFDLIEYDLCEIISKIKYRSSLIEDDYFTRFLQSNITKTNSYYRIKLIIYFIELIGIHMNKCQNKKQFQFNQNENKLFHSIEDFIRHIVSQTNDSIDEKISICFNVMELCLLFVNEKEIRIEQMALFLSELCQDNSKCLNLFLFDNNLLPDIRLLLINELISKSFNLKFMSINYVNEFFRQIQNILNSSEPINDFALLLLRSLFTTYADLITEIKVCPFMYTSFVQQLTNTLRNQLELVFVKLIEVSSNNSIYFEQMKRTLIFYRLLTCRWNKL